MAGTIPGWNADLPSNSWRYLALSFKLDPSMPTTGVQRQGWFVIDSWPSVFTSPTHVQSQENLSLWPQGWGGDPVAGDQPLRFNLRDGSVWLPSIRPGVWYDVITGIYMSHSGKLEFWIRERGQPWVNAVPQRPWDTIGPGAMMRNYAKVGIYYGDGGSYAGRQLSIWMRDIRIGDSLSQVKAA